MAGGKTALDLSVVVPVYGSENTLRPLTERLVAVLEDLGVDYEVVFVEDDSFDDAWKVLQQLHREFGPRLTAIRLMRNFGQHNAVMCGFRHARGELILTMDDDLQHPPEEIPKLLGALASGELDLVYGSYGEKKHERWRNLGSYLINLVYAWVFKVDVPFSSLRLIRRELVEAVLAYDLNFTFIDGLLAWNTTKIGAVRVRHAERHDGRSGYSLGKLGLLSLSLLTNFSRMPLQASTLVGLLSSGFGLAVGIYYLVQAALGRIAVPGYASLITAILFLGGIQLLALGVIGEYVGRLHVNANGKPQYREREILRAKSASGAE